MPALATAEQASLLVEQGQREAHLARFRADVGDGDLGVGQPAGPLARTAGRGRDVKPHTVDPQSVLGRRAELQGHAVLELVAFGQQLGPGARGEKQGRREDERSDDSAAHPDPPWCWDVRD